MVLYYTGTGNSEYVAKRIAAAMDDECMNLFEKLRDRDMSEMHSEKAFVIVCPTYGWQIPHILRDWMKQVQFTGSSDIYFVMTCGGDIGNAVKHLVPLCKEMNMNLKGCAEVVMPENYIALFKAPDQEEASEIISKAETVIDEIANNISNSVFIQNKSFSMSDSLKSGIVNTVFYSVFVHAKKFYATDACVGCGKCADACVLKNIKLVEGKPKWEDNCTHCMACICGCPVEAIEYGNASKGKVRYQCPKK